ncbi:hypothetical protein ACFQE7_14885 [Nonomuraea ferruginea]
MMLSIGCGLMVLRLGNGPVAVLLLKDEAAVGARAGSGPVRFSGEAMG